MFRFFRQRRRRRLRRLPLPAGWPAAMERLVPYVEKLTPAERRELEGHVQVFLAEKRFQGGRDLEVTDEMRLSIATQACVLLLNRETDYFPRLRTVTVHAGSFLAPRQEPLDGGAVLEYVEPLHGESWSLGQVVLSWEEVQYGARYVHDGINVVFHEFAHQLDAETGDEDGTPRLPGRAAYRHWEAAWRPAWEQLQADLDAGRPTFFEEYAGTTPAEFFAVATEVFFERPRGLARHHPDLYEQLRAYYRQDPARRFAGDALPPGDRP